MQNMLYCQQTHQKGVFKLDNVSLTPVDREILTSYKILLDGLSAYLGPAYEIVLHSLEDPECSAVKVINGHFTGRSEGAPITDLGMQMLEEIRKSGDNRRGLVYFNKNRSGQPMKSTTIPIPGENGRIIGLLCINLHMEVPFSTILEGLMPASQDTVDVTETFVSNSDALIRKAVEAARTQAMNNPDISAANKNKEIISLLKEKKIFTIKGAAGKVAEQLGISVNTVYLHLRNT